MLFKFLIRIANHNLVRVTTSGCGTAIEDLSIFVEKCLYSEVLKIDSRAKDSSEMLPIIDTYR